MMGTAVMLEYLHASPNDTIAQGQVIGVNISVGAGGGCAHDQPCWLSAARIAGRMPKQKIRSPSVKFCVDGNLQQAAPLRQIVEGSRPSSPRNCVVFTFGALA